MSKAPVGNETAVFMRNASDYYGIGLKNTGELVALRHDATDAADRVLSWDFSDLNIAGVEITDINIIIAIIYPQLEAQKLLMAAILEPTPNTRTISMESFEPVILDSDIGVAYEKMNVDKRYYRRHDRPRIFFDKSVTINWTWNPTTWLFNSLYFGDVNGNDAPHGVQDGLADDVTDDATWRPRIRCFELNDPFNGEHRGYHVRVVMGKMSTNWRIADIEDSCFSAVSDTPNMDDLSDQGVELYGTKFDFTHLNVEYVIVDDEGFPVSSEIWGTNVGSAPT